MLNILHVIRSSDPRGGGPIEAIRQADAALRPLGHMNEIVCVDPAGSQWVSDLEVPTIAVGPGVTPLHYSREFSRWMRDNVKRFDCVIIHSLWLHPGHSAAKYCRRAGIPYFVYTHGTLDPLHRKNFPLKHPKKTLVWWLKERRLLREATAVLFTCDLERDLASTSFWPQMTLDNATVLPYCTGEPPADRERQQAKFNEAFPHLQGKRLLLFLSRLHPKKGCDLAIAAFDRVADMDPDVYLVMAGPDRDPSFTAKITRLASNSAHADRICFTGMLDGDLKWGAFRSAEAFLLPSHQENFGIAVVEALACGLPTLITEQINIWPVIAKYRAGIVKTDSLEDTEAMLREWLGLSPQQRSEFSAAARECFEKEFSVARVAPMWLSTLKAFGVGN